MNVYAGVLVHSRDEYVNRNSEIELILNSIKGIHIDFADGEFVPNTLLPLREFVLNKNVLYEAHMMILNPDRVMDQYITAGFKKLIMHLDSFDDPSYENALRIQDYLHTKGVTFCLAFQKGCIVELKDLLCKFDCVQVMTIELGDSGLPFDVHQVETIQLIHDYCPDLPVQVDGHITDTTIHSVREAGATDVVSTSWLSGSDIKNKILKLQNG
jgi:ribulose-phosphate 3-epimerase